MHLIPYTHVGFDGEEPKENNKIIISYTKIL